MKDYAIITAALVYLFVRMVSVHLVYREDFFAMSFLDVGQGDAILVTAGDTTVLVDGGEYYTVDSIIDKEFGNFFCDFDIVFPTHIDVDHIGGLSRLLSRCQVPELRFNDVDCVSSTCARFKEQLVDLNVLNTFSGDIYTLDNLRIKVLWPSENFYLNEFSGDPNDISTVLLVQYKQFDALLTGDLPGEFLETLDMAEIESMIVGDLEVYKVPHHGSSDGMAPALLAQLNPVYCVISCGAGNKYGHPHEEVLMALEKAGCMVLRTDQEGTIEFKIQ